MKWTSVKDTFPQEGEIVILAVKQDEGPEGVFTYTIPGIRLGNTFWEGIERDDAQIKGVTHWMPLPPAPHNKALHADQEHPATNAGKSCADIEKEYKAHRKAHPGR